MDAHEKSEIMIASVIFGVYIVYVLTKNACNTTAGYCTAAWGIFGIVFIGAVIFIMLKIFRA